MSRAWGDVAAMRQVHGTGPDGRLCGACAHCVQIARPAGRRGPATFRVCRRAPSSTGAHGQLQRPRWRPTFQACGLFQESEA